MYKNASTAYNFILPSADGDNRNQGKQMNVYAEGHVRKYFMTVLFYSSGHLSLLLNAIVQYHSSLPVTVVKQLRLIT